MARIINLTESDLNRIIRRVMNESNEIQKIDTGLLSKLSEFAKNLSTELGQDIDVETIQDTAVCTIDEIQPETQIGEKESGVLQQVKSKIKASVLIKLATEKEVEIQNLYNIMIFLNDKKILI